ncbi:hypothetical protein OG933_45165 (plasmid) [Streptomyces sp. NBC_00016]|uniref:hypothetical protein n=1 Tax=Streptomyces sp. NBC_00016 TaxID=2975622 RepID=UPI002F9174FB
MAHSAPAIGDDGAANGFTAVTAKFTALKKAAAGLMEEADLVAERMRSDARASLKLADLCTAAEVDPKHIAAVIEIGQAFDGAVHGCKGLQTAAEGVLLAAGHAGSEHQAEYGAVHEAVTSSPARQARAGFYRPF